MIILSSHLHESSGEAALDYARRGWPVFPLQWPTELGRCSCGNMNCDRVAKHPCTPHGFKDATLDENMITNWWARFPQANIGIACAESGFFVLGPDGQEGIEALAELVRKYGPLPPTPRARSGGGGQHYYFEWPSEGAPIKTCANVNSLPLDVRGLGGYSV